jgi:uncharacterized membrane protein
MSDLVVLGFDGLHTADEVLNKLRSLQKEYLLDLEDACMVERDATGTVHVKQAVNLTTAGAAMGGSRGAFWGALIGLLFLNPLAGFGIPDSFVKKLGETIPNNSSALFVVFKSLNMDKVLPEIEPYKPRVLKTSLSNEADRRFTAVLGKVA